MYIVREHERLRRVERVTTDTVYVNIDVRGISYISRS